MNARFYGLGILILLSTTILRLNCQKDEWMERSANFLRKWEFKSVDFLGTLLNGNLPEEERIFIEYAIYMGGDGGYCICDDACSVDDIANAYAALGRLYTKRSFNPIHYLKLCAKYDSYRNYGICKCTDVYWRFADSIVKDRYQQPQKTAIVRYYPELGLIQVPYVNAELATGLPEPYWKQATSNATERSAWLRYLCSVVTRDVTTIAVLVG